MQASVRAVETRNVPTADAAPVDADPVDADPVDADPVDADVPGTRDHSADAAGDAVAARVPPRRVPERGIELVGLAVAIGFVAAVALNHPLSNDELWSFAAGQWMLTHHSIMGLDPFSYTEAHRRWVTDEWGSEVVLAGSVRAFGAAAYSLYAIVLGGLSLWISAAYARALGARGGRVAAIVLLLALGLAGTVVYDRGLDFSLVWFPLELLVLTRARRDPRWLWLLPALCVAWVNTHGSILLGLLVLGVELAWSLVPAGLVQRIGGSHRSPYPTFLALALVAGVAASCITPYGPGLLVYDVNVTRNSQISQYISEWASPDFHSSMTLLVFLVPLALLVACLWTRRIPLLECSLGALFFVEALRTQRLAVYLMVVAAGLAACLPARPPWGAVARRAAAIAFAGLAVVIVAAPSVPAGTVSASEPVQAFDYLQSHQGRIFTEYSWGDYSIARHRATFVDGRTDLFEGKVLTTFFDVMNLTLAPDPVFSAYHVDYVVWAPQTSLAVYLAHDPRWRVADRSAVAVVFARRAQPRTASTPRVSPSSSSQVSIATNL